jgi:acyl carrier protein
MTHEQRVIRIIKELFWRYAPLDSRKEITPETRFREDLNADSLDAIELLMEMEAEFDIAIPDDVVDEMRTVADAVRYITTRLAEGKP